MSGHVCTADFWLSPTGIATCRVCGSQWQHVNVEGSRNETMTEDNRIQPLSAEMLEEVQYWAEHPIQDEPEPRPSIDELRVAAKEAVRNARTAENTYCYHDGAYGTRQASEDAYNAALKAIDALAAAVEVVK